MKNLVIAISLIIAMGLVLTEPYHNYKILLYTKVSIYRISILGKVSIKYLDVSIYGIDFHKHNWIFFHLLTYFQFKLVCDLSKIVKNCIAVDIG